MNRGDKSKPLQVVATGVSLDEAVSFMGAMLSRCATEEDERFVNYYDSACGEGATAFLVEVLNANL